MTEDTYLTIRQSGTGNFRDRKSRFSGLAFPISSESDIKEILKKLKKEYYDATHHCYAWVMEPDGSKYRSNDDGEPGGSAGLPILGQIQSRKLTNVLVVVVRYYGGVKLGVPGLIHAYRAAAALALDDGKTIEKIVCEALTLNFPYVAMNAVMSVMKDFSVHPQNQIFELDCSMDVEIRRSHLPQVTESLGKIQGLTIKTKQNGPA
jgi:uncharacterized YigZ family protein